MAQSANWRTHIPRRDLDCRSFHLQFLDFASGQIKAIVDIEDIGEGISVSPDGRSLLFTERSQTNSDIMLVENFRLASERPTRNE